MQLEMNEHLRLLLEPSTHVLPSIRHPTMNTATKLTSDAFTSINTFVGVWKDLGDGIHNTRLHAKHFKVDSDNAKQSVQSKAKRISQLALAGDLMCSMEIKDFSDFAPKDNGPS